MVATYILYAVRKQTCLDLCGPKISRPANTSVLLILRKRVYINITSLAVYWSESLTTNHEVPGSIPGSTVGIFPEGEDSRGDHGLGRLVEFRFKGPPGTTSSYITTHIIGTT